VFIQNESLSVEPGRPHLRTILDVALLQAHFENLLNKKFYLNADGNNNISPGSPRGVRVGLIAGF
jgi:catecholate siderophore receptor